MSRNASLINAFQIMCQLEPVDFDRLAAKAEAMRMQPVNEPPPSGLVTRNKAWTGSLKTGPFGFMLDEMDNPKVKGTSCAISADVPDVDSFRREAIKTLHLSDNPMQADHAGLRNFAWPLTKPNELPHQMLFIADTTPQHQSSIMIKISFLEPR